MGKEKRGKNDKDCCLPKLENTKVYNKKSRITSRRKFL